MPRVVKLSIRFVLYRSADDDDDDNDDDAVELSFSRCFAPTFPTVSRYIRKAFELSRMNVWQCHKWGRQWAMVGTCTVVRELWNWSNARPPSGWETTLRNRFDAVLPSHSPPLSLSFSVCLSLEEIVRRNLCQSGKIRVLHELYKQP